MKLKRLRHRDKRYKHFLRFMERYHRHKHLSSFEEYYKVPKMGISNTIEEESFSESEKRSAKMKDKYSKALILRALIQDERDNSEQK